MATYLVTQATGQQSQWTITHLLQAGAEVHALVRDPQKTPSWLHQPGVTIFKGQSDDYDSVFQAALGCVGVFLNTFPIPGLETKQARTIVDASLKAGVQTVVASTTFCVAKRDLWDNDATRRCELDGYFSSKAQVEQIVRSAGFKAYTILRPGWIHGDFFLPRVSVNTPNLPRGEFDHALDDGARMLYTDASDIGRYAAAALLEPARFDGHEIDLGVDFLTAEEVRDVLVRVSGRHVVVHKRTIDEVDEAKVPVPGQKFQLWVSLIDISPVVSQARATAEKYGIPVNTLEEALQRDRGLLLECLPASA